MQAHLRLARPVSDLERTVAMYRSGLGLTELGRFEDHDGFDGVMLGVAGLDYHFEFTKRRGHPVMPAPTAEDLAVFYLPDPDEWQVVCRSMLDAGFVAVDSFNPYWRERGRSFADHDGYRIVLERATWQDAAGGAAPAGTGGSRA